MGIPPVGWKGWTSGLGPATPRARRDRPRSGRAGVDVHTPQDEVGERRRHLLERTPALGAEPSLHRVQDGQDGYGGQGGIQVGGELALPLAQRDELAQRMLVAVAIGEDVT